MFTCDIILFMNQYTKQLMSILHGRGILSASEMSQTIGVSQPTISRSLAGVSSRHLLRLGNGRATNYAARRQIRETGSEWPLYNILADGEIELVGSLYSLAPRNWYLKQDAPWNTLRGGEFPNGIYPGLPWFLSDLRPLGFLGRAFARNYASDIGAPTDPRLWSDDDIIIALTRYGYDLPGSFVVGHEMITRHQKMLIDTTKLIACEERSSTYPLRADDIIRDGLPGSSAAGEQPKFTAQLINHNKMRYHVIVKFSGNAGRPEDQRWADLLIAENVANTVLRAQGIPAGETTILQSQGRTFLESRRFDRVGNRGRKGLVSLEALDAAFFGQIETPWTEAARRLIADRWISEQDAHHLQVLWWFGTFIGNTDMHYGNTSFHLSPSLPLTLAPVYDMVPMRYRPNQEGGLPEKPVNPPPPSPMEIQQCSLAATTAESFWQTLCDTPNVSDNFIAVSRNNIDIIQAYRREHRL